MTTNVNLTETEKLYIKEIRQQLEEGLITSVEGYIKISDKLIFDHLSNLTGEEAKARSAAIWSFAKEVEPNFIDWLSKF